MKKIWVFAAVVGLCSTLGVAQAQQAQRRATVVRQVPQRQVVQPRLNNQVRAGNHVASARPGMQQHLGNLGRHGLPMISGRFGMHERRNRSAIALIPGLGESDTPIDVDTFIDSVDYSTSYEALDPCEGQCASFSAISVSNDGKSLWASSYPTAEAASNGALNACLQAATEQCVTLWVGGTNWVASIYCENDSFHWGGLYGGNSLRSAIANVYRFAVQERGYNPNECQLLDVIAADGSQNRFAQQE